ncbi:MAG: hypothetical protein M1426_04050 [Patescibacteria group bacterium]|nr:hypothetical protein [Patescibacteria group bacterium]
MFLVSGIFLWPFWAGIFAAGIKVNTWVKVPDDYIKANDWLNSQKGDFRIFHLPIVPGDGIRYTWQHSYQGVEAGAYIFDKSSIGHNVGFNRSYYSVLLRRFEGLPEGAYGQEPGPESSAFKSDTFSDELSKLNVRYIILHHDIDYKLTNARNPDLDVNYLASQQNISKIATFGKLDIYQVDIPKNIDLVYSPDAQVSFSKINSTEYIVNLKNAKSQTELYLLEVFDPKWEAFIDGHKVNEHSNVFSYANKWKLDKPGDYSMVIKYKPQEFVNKGLMISTWSIVAMLILSLLMKIRSIIGGIVRIVENTWSLRKT